MTGSGEGKGDRQGLAGTFLAEQPRLLRFFTARTGSREEAEDVLQELWLRLQATEADGPVAHPLAYLHRMGLNLVVDRARERQRRDERERGWSDVHVARLGLDAVDETPDPHRALAARQRAARLAAAVATLPPGAGRVFRLHKLEGFTHAEVAARLGISRSAVEKHMAVALRHLQAACGEPDGS